MKIKRKDIDIEGIKSLIWLISSTMLPYDLFVWNILSYTIINFAEKIRFQEIQLRLSNSAMGKVDIQQLDDVANHLRIDSIKMTCAAKSGHPTSSCSAAEIIATLFFNEMKFDKAFPKDPSSDRFVLSKVQLF